MRQVLGGQCLAGLGVASGAAFALSWVCEVGVGSALKEPGTDELSMFSVDVWTSCGQCQSGFGLKEVEAIAPSRIEIKHQRLCDVIIRLPK